MSETPRWVREARTSRLADLALVADDRLRAGSKIPETWRRIRRIALDELVRRGDLDGYEFLPEPLLDVPSQAQRARTLRLRTY